MTTSAGVVVGWAHQSGHGHDATAVSGAAPTLATAVVSGHDGIRFASAGTIAMTFTSSLPWDGALVLSFAFRHRTPPMQTGLLFGGALRSRPTCAGDTGSELEGRMRISSRELSALEACRESS